MNLLFIDSDILEIILAYFTNNDEERKEREGKDFMSRIIYHLQFICKNLLYEIQMSRKHIKSALYIRFFFFITIKQEIKNNRRKIFNEDFVSLITDEILKYRISKL